MSESRSPIMNAVLGALNGGGWVDGLRVLRQTMRVVPPPEASRHALRLRESEGATGETPPLDKLIESGRRSLARDAIAAAVKRGRLVVDVPEITRLHWRGEAPWKLRDTEAGLLSVAEIAELVDITTGVAATWIRKGFVPAPVESASGARRITPDQVPAWRAVRDAWPGPKKHWLIDPRSLWNVPSQACPHCGEPIAVTIGKA